MRPEYRSPDLCKSEATWHIRYVLSEPRDAAYAIPRRIVCWFTGRHSPACAGNRRCYDRMKAQK